MAPGQAEMCCILHISHLPLQPACKSAALLPKSASGLGSTKCRAPQHYIPCCLTPGPHANSLAIRWGWDCSSVLLRIQRRCSGSAQVVFNKFISKPAKIQLSPMLHIQGAECYR